MRTSMAYFAGAGTVVIAIAAGLGAGLLIANTVNPPSSNKEMTKLEQRMSSKPIPVSNAPSEPVHYLATTQPAGAGPVTGETPVQNQPQDETAKGAAPQAKPADGSVASNAAANAPATNATQQQPPAAQASVPDQAKAPEDAYAKARDVDRKMERRQQWTERRRYRQDYRDRQDQELRDVELKVREETEPTRAFAAEPARMEMPRIKLFGDD